MRSAIVIIAMVLGACFGASALAQQAQTDATRFANVERVVIVDFTGRIEIEVQGGDIAVALSDAPTRYLVNVEREDAVLLIAGEDRSKKFDIKGAMNWRLHGQAAFAHYVDGYPRLQLSVPEGTAIEMNDVYAIAAIGDLGGPFALESQFVEARIGRVETADIALHGGGFVAIGPVRSHLRAKVGGAGGVEAVSAGSAELLVGGSGGVVIGDIAGDAALRVSGSGDIAAHDIAGRLSAFVSGSGDIDAGAIGGGAEFSIGGSGDIAARSLSGPALARIAGNGDITVEVGRAEDLKVGITGAGDFRFGGVSTNLDATVNGAGSIDIAENEGVLKTSGSGAVRIGNNSINNKD